MSDGFRKNSNRRHGFWKNMSVLTNRNLGTQYERVCLGDPVIMCYFPSKARLRTNIVKFEMKDVDFTLCTHYIYASAKIDNISRTLVANDPAEETGPHGLYRAFTNARNNFTSIKMLLTVGGYGADVYQNFKYVSQNDTILSGFVTSAVNLLRQHGFDGLDIDWPTSNSGSKAAYTSLIEALRAKFNEDTHDRLMLTAKGTVVEILFDGGYDIAAMARILDYVILSTHELFLVGLPLAQFPCPLFSSRTDVPYNMLSLNYTVYDWNSKGMPFNKMVMGLPVRGLFKELINTSDHQPWSPVKTNYISSPLFQIDGFLSYLEICRIYNDSQKYYDEIQKSPYLMYNRTFWVGYDDTESLDLKVEFVTRVGVAGVMFESLDYDDFLGTFCGKGKFPLLLGAKNTALKTLHAIEEDERNSNRQNSTRNSTDSDSNSTSATGGGTDSNAKAAKHRTGEDSNIFSNLLYGFLITVIPVVCLATVFLCGNKRQPQNLGETHVLKQRA